MIAKLADISGGAVKSVAAAEATNRLDAIVDEAQLAIVIRRQDRDIAVKGKWRTTSDYDPGRSRRFWISGTRSPLKQPHADSLTNV